MIKNFQKTINSLKSSTNVRQTYKLLKRELIIAQFQVLSKISPKLAARQGMQQFFRTYRYTRPDRENTLLLTATEKFTINWKGEKLAAWAWGAGPTILLVHGWNGRGAQLGSIVVPLVEMGYRVVTFDALGHGDSPGQKASLVDFSETVSAALEQLGSVAGVIAHSLGSAATTLALLNGAEIPWLVYIAPPLQPRDYLYKFATFLKASPEITHLMKEIMSNHFRRSWESLDIPNLVKSLETPLLVIHDKEDKEVFWSEGEALVKAWPKAKLITTQGLGHSRILRQEEVVKQIVDFVQSTQYKSQITSTKHINSLVSKKSSFGKYKCSQEGCENYLTASWNNSDNRCLSCLMDAELFEPALRWSTHS